MIVPVYNVAPYLEECVNSILHQTYRNLEIFLVDDGSSDGSGEMCEHFEDSRIVVIHQPNQGLSAARNTAIDRAKGEYFLFVDSDDCIESDMAERMVEECIRQDVLMAVCNYRLIEEDSSVRGLNEEYGDELVPGWQLLRGAPKGGYFVVAWNKLYHRSLFEGVRYPVGKLHEDVFVIGELMLNCPEVAMISDVLYSYRSRGQSIMKNKENIRRLDAVEGYLKLGRQFLDTPELKTEAWSPVSQAFYLYVLYCRNIGWRRSNELRNRSRELRAEFLQIKRECAETAPFAERLKNYLFGANFYWGARVSDFIMRMKDRMKG